MKSQEYRVEIFAFDQQLDPLDDNVDVQVTLSNGEFYTATFFTLKNLETLFEKNRETGECSDGLFLYASDMIIVRTLTRQTIEQTIECLVASNALEHAFSGPFPVEDDCA